jgi:hypothetical protein
MEKSRPMRIGGTSHNRLYWRYWLILTGLLLILRFTLFRASSDQARFYLFIAFAILTWMPTVIIFAYETRRHVLYLYAHFPHVPPRSPLVYPYILRIRSRVAKEELEVPAVRSIIRRYRRFIHFMWVEFLSFAVLYVVVMIDRVTLSALIDKIVP